MLVVHRGDIYLADLGEGVGSEQRGERPVLIVQNNKGNIFSPTVTVLPITTKIHKSEGMPTHVIIDDINGLSDNIEFTNWYKSLFESIQFNEYHIPAVFALISYPKEFENLCLINESFSRIFKLIEIDKLEDEEIEEFFKYTFENSIISIIFIFLFGCVISIKT